MRFPELRWSPPRKVISEGVAVSAPFELRNISEKKFPFFEKGRRKEGLGGGGGGAVWLLLLFFYYGAKVKNHSPGVGGGGGRWGGWWPSNGMALEINFAKEGIGCPFWTESL